MKKKGFTFIELLLGLSIMTIVFIAVMTYIMVVGKTERKVKLTIDRFNVAQSILTELKNWDYRGSNKKNLVSLKTYLEETDPEYLAYMADEALYNVETGPGGVYYLRSDEGTKLRIKVNLDFMQEDTADIDGDGITNELVHSNSDQNIMRITVSVAEHFDNVAESHYVWASAVGYKGVKSDKPTVDIYFNDISDDDMVVSTSGAVALFVDMRKNADIINGLNHLKNLSPFDRDGIDNNENGLTDYTEGDILEADSDGIDNNNNGIIDEAFEQNNFQCHYEGVVYSADPFKLLHVNLTAPDGSVTDIASHFTANSDNTLYRWAVSEGSIGNYSGGWVIYDTTANGKYTVEVEARTNPNLETGVILDKRTYDFIVDTVAPEITEISPAPGTFVPHTMVTLAVTVKDNPPGEESIPTSGLDRVYVFEKEEFDVGGDLKYHWKLMGHQLIEKESSDIFSSMNVGINLEGVSEGWHYYRVLVKDRAGNASAMETEVYVTSEPDIKPPRIYPLLPYDPAGTAQTGSPTPQVAARIVDSTIINGIETESGVLVAPLEGHPRVLFRVLETGDPTTIDWTNTTGFSDVSAQVAYIKHNINNVTLQFSPGVTLAEGDIVLVGIEASDKAGNISRREWLFTYDSNAGNNDPFIDEVTVQQLANHPNLEPPYIYNPYWVSGGNTQANRNFYIGWHASDSNGIALVALHYTAVGDTTVKFTKSREILEQPMADSFGFELDDLNISQPGTFYYYISVTDGAGGNSYYYLDADGQPAQQQTPPGDAETDYIPVRVEQLRVLVFDMDTEESGSLDNVRPFYTAIDGPLYWNDLDCNVVEVAQNAEASTLMGYIDDDDDGYFDDYDLIIFYTGSTASPPGFTDDFIRLIHSWMTAPYEDFRTFYAAVQEGINGDLDMFHSTGDKTVVSPHYREGRPPRVAFIGKRFFDNFDSTSPLTSDMKQYFIRRWLGLGMAGKQEYSDFSTHPYVVSNLQNPALWVAGATTIIGDPVFGATVGVMKKDSNENDLPRSVGSNYLRRYLLAPVEGEYYDGYANQDSPVPHRWSLGLDILSADEKLGGKRLLANPAIHGYDYNGTDGYLMAGKQALVYGYDPDNIAFTAGVWVYNGKGAVDDWDFEIIDEEPGETDTKLLYLGFGIEAISTENWRYEAMKSLVRFLYY